MMQNYGKNPKPARNETKFNNAKSGVTTWITPPSL